MYPLLSLFLSDSYYAIARLGKEELSTKNTPFSCGRFLLEAFYSSKDSEKDGILKTLMNDLNLFAYWVFFVLGTSYGIKECLQPHSTHLLSQRHETCQERLVWYSVAKNKHDKGKVGVADRNIRGTIEGAGSTVEYMQRE